MAVRYSLVALVAAVAAACGRKQGSPEGREERIAAMDSAASPAALQRRERSVLRLKAEGVPVNPHLPVIEDETEMRRRTREEVARRTMALLLVASKGDGLRQEVLARAVDDYGVRPDFSPEEAAFVGDPAPSDHDRMQFTWRFEAACTLLWALGYVDELEKPTETCDVERAVAVLMDRSRERFIAEAKLRSPEEILDQADLIYRYHWAVVDARLNGKPVPAGLDPDVVMERHYALNWLIGYMDQEWDDVSTDT
jgi:hypothetical protein